ncbi:hypothetical protein FCM35_KLT16348 [Carex littledalei]|uniref:Uncharacterized protein n=1 Tax=Carex littledalei TaxID=544730 RepID=A0A833VGE0_9POAL|nr:hypothetical protein FCM35_KLT16348 [Carex littledalei]
MALCGFVTPQEVQHVLATVPQVRDLIGTVQLKTLEAATGNFSEANLLSRCGFGPVYKHVLYYNKLKEMKNVLRYLTALTLCQLPPVLCLLWCEFGGLSCLSSWIDLHGLNYLFEQLD